MQRKLLRSKSAHRCARCVNLPQLFSIHIYQRNSANLQLQLRYLLDSPFLPPALSLPLSKNFLGKIFAREIYFINKFSQSGYSNKKVIKVKKKIYTYCCVYQMKLKGLVKLSKRLSPIQ